MIYLFDTFFFVLGTIIGSFLNVVILRYNTGESVMDGRSHCFNCGKILGWMELIPFFSFLFLRGKCKSCKSKISWQYPLVELVTGVVYLLIFLKIQSLPEWQNLSTLISTFFAFLVFSILIVISVYDIRHQIIPDAWAYVLAGLTAVPVLYKLFTIGDFSKLSVMANWQDFSAGLFLAAFFAFFWLVSRGKWMGLGDAKLSLGIGWFLGLPKTLVALVFSFWLGAIVGISLIILERKKYKISSAIPFGPFLAIGTLIAFLFGDMILKDYIYYFNVI